MSEPLKKTFKEPITPLQSVVEIQQWSCSWLSRYQLCLELYQCAAQNLSDLKR